MVYLNPKLRGDDTEHEVLIGISKFRDPVNRLQDLYYSLGVICDQQQPYPNQSAYISVEIRLKWE